MAPNCRAQALGNALSACGRRAQQGDKLVAAPIREQLAFTEIRPRQIEDDAQHDFSVRLTMLIGQASVLVDIRYEKGNRTPRTTRLGN